MTNRNQAICGVNYIIMNFKGHYTLWDKMMPCRCLHHIVDSFVPCLGSGWNFLCTLALREYFESVTCSKVEMSCELLEFSLYYFELTLDR